jgi:hypothetical protein
MFISRMGRGGGRRLNFLGETRREDRGEYR